jgi:hypothetical protein
VPLVQQGAYDGHLYANEGGAPLDVALPPIPGFGIGVFVKEPLKRGDVGFMHAYLIVVESLNPPG